MNLKENPQNSKWFYLNLSSNSVVFDAKNFHFSFLNTSFVNANSIQTAQKTLLMSFLCQNLRNRSVFPSYFCHIQSVDLPFFCTLSFVECSKAENRNFSISQNKHERTSKMSTDKNPIISIELVQTEKEKSKRWAANSFLFHSQYPLWVFSFFLVCAVVIRKNVNVERMLWFDAAAAAVTASSYSTSIEYAKTRHLYAKPGCNTEQLPSNCYYYWFLKSINTSRKKLWSVDVDIDRNWQVKKFSILSLCSFPNEDAIRIFWVSFSFSVSV